jgi:hypothetical protein
MTDRDLLDLLQFIIPELRCIRDCEFTADHTVVIRPDTAAIRVAVELLARLGAST